MPSNERRRVPLNPKSSSRCRLTHGPQSEWPAPFAPPELPGFITTMRQSAPGSSLDTFSLMVKSTCAFSLCISIPGSHVPLWRQCRVHAACTPVAAWAVSRYLPDSSRELLTSAVLTTLLYLTMRHTTVRLRSSPRHLPDILVWDAFSKVAHHHSR